MGMNGGDIDLKSLMRLQDSFGENGELDEAEFVAAFGSILGSNLNEQQLTHLFMKIDANSDGSVDWDEFTNYMFLGNQESGAANAAEDSVSLYLDIGDSIFDSNNSRKNMHKTKIICLHYIEKTQSLASVGTNGLVKLWCPTNLMEQTSFVIDCFQRNHHRKDHVTSSVYFPGSNLLGVSTIGNGLSFIDICSDYKKVIRKISSKDLGYASAICLDVHYDSAKQSELLSIGCDDGTIHWYVINAKEWCNSLDKRVAKLHTDHVSMVQYVPGLTCIVTSSLDGTLCVVDAESGKTKRVFSQHKKAVYSFAWCSSAKVIASCGLEWHIILWSPYSEHSIACLQGHNTSIHQLCYCESMNHLISISGDNIIKIWDVRNHRCMQTLLLDDKTRVSSLLHLENMWFYTATYKIKLWPLKHNLFAKQTMTNTKPSIVSIMYNHSFNQVVTADQDAHVYIWDLSTGQLISNFQAKSHSTAKHAATHFGLKLPLPPTGEPYSFDQIVSHLQPMDENSLGASENSLTCMCFDHGGRRLITGSNAGDSLNIWNFSNGCLLQSLLKEEETSSNRETTAVSYVINSLPPIPGKPLIQNRYIISVGWDRRIYVWIDGCDASAKTLKYHKRIPEDLNKAHATDILCVQFISPMLIATGGSDGHVMLWNLSTGESFMKLSLHSSVDSLTYLEKHGLLIAINNSGIAWFIHVKNRSLLDKLNLSFDTNQSIILIKSDSLNECLITVDNAGEIKVWTINMGIKSDCILTLRMQWNLGPKRITSMDYVESKHHLETFLLIGDSDGSIGVYTLSGFHLGNLGSEPWDLKKSRVLDKSVEVDYSVVNLLSKEERMKRAQVEVTSDQTTTKWTPSPGDVWSRGFGNGEEILTVVQVVEGEVRGINGRSEQIARSVDELRTSDWMLNEKLTKYIGRIYYHNQKPYKIVHVRVDSKVVDFNNIHHPLPTQIQSNITSTSLSLLNTLMQSNKTPLPTVGIKATNSLTKAPTITATTETPSVAVHKKSTTGLVATRPPSYVKRRETTTGYTSGVHRLIRRRLFGNTDGARELLEQRRALHKPLDIPVDYKHLRANLTLNKHSFS